MDRTTEPAASTCRQLFTETPADNVEETSELRARLVKVEPEPDVQPGSGGEVEQPQSRPRHQCPHCPKNFGSPGKLDQHLYSHTGERPFPCEHCKKAFSSRFRLVRHALIHSDIRQYRCVICDRTFHRKDHLKNHSKVHSPVKRVYICDRVNCSKQYFSPISYRKHTAVHAAEDGNLNCIICGKVCSSKEEIVLHLKMHAGSRTVKTQADRKYICELCGRSFYTGKDVRRHHVVHTGKRDFLCQFCPQRFGRKDHLVRHIKKSHNHTGKRGKKRSETRTRTVTSIMQEASTSRGPDLEQIKSESSESSFGILEEEGTSLASTSTNLPPTSTEIYKSESTDLGVHYGQSEEMLSETSGSMMSENLYQPPPPYGLHRLPPTMTFGPSTSQQAMDIKPEIMTEYMTLEGLQQFQGPLPPNLLMTATDPTGFLPSSHFVGDPQVEPSLHRQIMQMSNYVAPQTGQSSSSDTDLLISQFMSTSEAPTSSTPLPRFNQAFHQQPPP